jgi:hypothetical protein
MLLAELEVWHSRPLAPTRRIALGHLLLPVEPPPGFGGLLIGAVVARFLPQLDDDLVPDLVRLVNQLDRGERIVQPRLRHRYQVDRHGLGRSTHRLVGQGESIAFELEGNGTPLQQLLGAVYAVERLGPEPRRAVLATMRRAMAWTGPVGPSFIAYLAGVGGARASSVMAFADPVTWALEILGFPPGTVTPSKRDVMARFRQRLMEVHPDHGGDESTASGSIGDLGEARAILLARR